MEKEKRYYEFSADKNQLLIKERGISFEDVITAIEGGAALDVVPHSNRTKYPNQEMYVVNINNYVYLIPFVRKDKNTVFLKTIIPHRKSTKLYLRGGKHEKEKT